MPRPRRRLVAHGVMVDEDTNECSLVSLPVPTVIALPPLPEDAPEPYLWFGCALLVQTTPPDCTVVLDFVRERCLLHCCPGDPEWSRLPMELVEKNDEFDGPITVGHQGKVYVMTMLSLVAMDVSSGPAVERADMTIPPTRPHAQRTRSISATWCRVLTASSSWCAAACLGTRMRCWTPRCSDGMMKTMPGRRSKSSPKVCYEFGIYTVSLHDMTIRISIVEGCDDRNDDGEDQVFWALPNR
ncbi:hypothetical protein ZWY2020_042241 [Hordeum vulgare]|nr:hypothetical protein ZWY2020_042241 [Hordeum vulgare]